MNIIIIIYIHTRRISFTPSLGCAFHDGHVLGDSILYLSEEKYRVQTEVVVLGVCVCVCTVRGFACTPVCRQSPLSSLEHSPSDPDSAPSHTHIVM